MKTNKEYWYITDKGDLDIDIDENKYKDKFRKHIGNYFKNVYEADKFLRKLESKKKFKIKLLSCKNNLIILFKQL